MKIFHIGNGHLEKNDNAGKRHFKISKWTWTYINFLGIQREKYHIYIYITGPRVWS
jgi:hypothetical protein